jgi:ribosome-associated protein
VNKVSSKAVLRWPVTASPSLPEDVRQRFLERFGNRVTTEGELVLSSERFRDQKRNQEDCLEKLRAMLLDVAVPPKERRPTKPTRGSQRRRLQNKQERSTTKRLRQTPGSND